MENLNHLRVLVLNRAKNYPQKKKKWQKIYMQTLSDASEVAYSVRGGGSPRVDVQFSQSPFNLFTRIRTPLSAERPSLGCSLPGLARFAWLTQLTAFLRKLLCDRQP